MGLFWRRLELLGRILLAVFAGLGAYSQSTTLAIVLFVIWYIIYIRERPHPTAIPYPDIFGFSVRIHR